MISSLYINVQELDGFRDEDAAGVVATFVEFAWLIWDVPSLAHPLLSFSVA